MDNRQPYGANAQFDGEFFDSQTEAAWASLFSAAGVNYVREPETFEFEVRDSNGQNVWDKRYTPDFLLPDFDMFVEVKNDSTTAEAIQKLILTAHFSGKVCLLAEGKPHNAALYLYEPAGVQNLRQKMNDKVKLWADHWAPNFRWQADPTSFPEPVPQLVPHIDSARVDWTASIDPEVRTAARDRKAGLVRTTYTVKRS